MINPPKPSEPIELERLDEILVDTHHLKDSVKDGTITVKEAILISPTLREAKAKILDLFKSLALEAIGEDEEQVLPHPKLDNYDAVQRCVGRNQLREELRTKAISILTLESEKQ